ncbi:hypothetical protein Agub_g2698, partial [Astrephomene gubernaculifera]
MAKQARNVVKELSHAAGAKKVAEADILERVEKMCDPDQDAGDWITRYDIVEQDTTLQLKDTGRLGKCQSECRTIARACEQISEDVDLTDLSAMLYKGKKRAAVSNWMCYDATDACTKKPPPVPKDRPAGEAHVPLSEEEVRNARMLRDMASAGLSGSLYSRESMMEELAELREEYGDDPDFNKILKETGMSEHVPPRPPSDGEGEGPASGSSGGASSSSTAAASALQERVAQAAEVVKEGA